MNTEDYIFIEVTIKTKYSNNILLDIPDLIKNYLFKNPNKHELYLNDKVNINDLIKYLANQKYLLYSNTELLHNIVSYVEGELWKT